MPLHVNNFLSWIRPTHVYVNDSGTWRSIKQLYVHDGTTWRLVFARTLNTALTAASQAGINIGYRLSPALGSLSPSSMPDDTVISQILYSTPDPATLTLYIGGFAADPGQSHLNYMEIVERNSQVNLGQYVGSAASYAYSSGSAQWTWSFVSDLFVGGQIYDIEIST